MIRNRKIEGKVQSFALRVDEAIRKAIDCQQGEAKRSYRGFVTVLISIIIIVLLLVLFGRVGFFTCFSIVCYCFSSSLCCNVVEIVHFQQVLKGSVLILFICWRRCGVNCPQGKCFWRGNKGSGTEISLCAIYLWQIIIETRGKISQEIQYLTTSAD